MSRIKNMLSAEVILTVALGLLAATNVTRPAPATPIQRIVVVVGNASPPDVQTTIYSATWCLPCRPYVRDVRTEFTKPVDGKPSEWIVRNEADKDAETAHIIIAKSDRDWLKENIQAVPTTIVRRRGKEVKRIQGRITPDELAAEINKAIRLKD